MRYRSAFVSLLAVFAMLLTGVAAVAAQDATPGATLSADELGLPELQIMGTDSGFEGLPEETEAGRYLITFTNEGSMDAAVGFVQLPEGRTVDDLAPPTTPTGPGPDATPGPGMASPEAGMEMASPAAEAQDPFAWLYETYIAGGVGAAAGETAQGIVDLQPGDYAVWADDPEAPFPPSPLTVTGDAATPAAMEDIEADVTVTEVKTDEGYAFELSGELATGPQLIEIYNDSDQPHFMMLLRSPGPITVEQLFQLFSLPEDATPPPGVPNPDELVTAAYAAVQSAGTTQYLAADLEPGYYIIACFVPDPTKGGIPHAAEGMIDVIPVGVEATPTS